MRLLGIDYGTKRIGLSLSDEGERLAFPHATIANDKKVLQELKAIIEQYTVGKIIVGESKDLSMKDNRLMDDVRFFVQELEVQTKLPVELHPEFMTSTQVSKTHFQLSERHKDRGVSGAKNLDAQAATIMLQHYIDSNKQK
jgi:putative holliday junction resolvase